MADDALATALTSSGSISEPCSPTMGASFDAVPSAFASEQAALLSPYRADQRQQHDKVQGHNKVSADGPAAPAAPAAASALGRPPLGRPAAGGSSGLHRSSGTHLKPHSVDAEWDPINVSWAVRGLQVAFAARWPALPAVCTVWLIRPAVATG